MANMELLKTNAADYPNLKSKLERKYELENKSIGINRAKFQNRLGTKLRTQSAEIDSVGTRCERGLVQDLINTDSEQRVIGSSSQESNRLDSNQQRVTKKVVGNGRYVKINHKYYEAARFLDPDFVKDQIKKGFKLYNGMIYVLFDGDNISQEKLQFIQQSWKYQHFPPHNVIRKSRGSTSSAPPSRQNMPSNFGEKDHVPQYTNIRFKSNAVFGDKSEPQNNLSRVAPLYSRNQIIKESQAIASSLQSSPNKRGKELMKTSPPKNLVNNYDEEQLKNNHPTEIKQSLRSNRQRSREFDKMWRPAGKQFVDIQGEVESPKSGSKKAVSPLKNKKFELTPPTKQRHGKQQKGNGQPQELHISKTIILSTPELRSKSRQKQRQRKLTSADKNYAIQLYSPSNSESKTPTKSNDDDYPNLLGRVNSIRVFTQDRKKEITSNANNRYKYDYSSSNSKRQLSPRSQLKSKVHPKKRGKTPKKK